MGLADRSVLYIHRMNTHKSSHRARLQKIAQRVMAERGFLAEFSPEALDELTIIQREPAKASGTVRDLRATPLGVDRQR